MSSAMSLTQKRISRAKHEAETSLANAKSLRDRWLAAVNHNPTNLTQKEIDHLGKALKNRLLSVKWDCEDLEELVSCGDDGGVRKSKQQANDLDEVKNLIDECKWELTTSMKQMESFEMNKKLFNKHGIVTTSVSACNSSTPTVDTIHQAANNVTTVSPMTTTSTSTTNTNTTTSVTSIIQNPLHNNPQYERLLNNSNDASNEFYQDHELHFDKRLFETNHATIFTNALYEHYDIDDNPAKGLNGTKVFNNLTRPNTDAEVFTGTNENEMILEMLETEYYNPPAGLLAKANCNTTIGKLFDTNKKRSYAFIILLPFLVVFLLFL